MKVFKNIIIFLICLPIISIYAMDVNPSDEILKKALNVEIKKISHFYANSSDSALNDLIELSQNALNDDQLLDRYSVEFKKNQSEIKNLLKKIIKKAKTRVKFSVAKDLRLQNQGKIGRQASMKPKKKAENIGISEIADGNSSLYIMLDIPDFNLSGKPIIWQEPIDNLISHIENADFMPEDYHHITLGWYKFKQPLTQNIRTTINRALDRASVDLKKLYPGGIKNIALLDGAFTLGKGAVVFAVAKNADLIRAIEVISEAFSQEKLTEFESNELKEESPLHITLGRIVPEKYAYDLRNQISKLDAPSGSRISQEESFASDVFRASFASKAGYHALGSYKF